MKKAKTSRVLLGYKFTKSYYFKIWRIFSKFKKFTNPVWYQKYVAKSQKYSHYSPDWIKKVILPSKAFSRWLTLYSLKINVKNYIFLIGKKCLPVIIKSFIKKHASAYFPLPMRPIPPKIQHKWNEWVDQRTDASLDIINFGIIAYNYRIQRPQHLATEMTKLGHRVFYIENEFVYTSSHKLPQLTVTQQSNNLFVVKLSSSVNYFIYQDAISDKDKKILLSSLKLLLRQARVLNPIAKIDHPFWASIADELGMPIIYDIMDLHSGFKETSQQNLKNEKQLLVKADLILASSSYIQHKFRRYFRKIISLKNAGEYQYFSTSSLSHKSRPLDIRHLPGPILGYFGALADWLNTDLIEGLARDFPKSSIVLIGLVNNPTLGTLSRQYSNIHLLGEKPYSELANYLAHFDVCLIPFKLTKLIQATNPVKIYEYFASGKPVVSTSIPELLTYKKMIYFADNPVTFSRSVNKAFSEKSPTLINSRQQIAKLNTWKNRVLLLQKHLMTLYPKVSIIILVYNHADLSKISIDTTLFRSKYPNFEILAVDNYSDQATIKMLHEYKGNNRLKLIFNPKNYGFAKGNNVGMHLAKGDYIILLNNDVRVTPGWIERLVYHSRMSSRVGLVGPVTNSIGNESKINIGYDPENQAELESQVADYTYSHWGEKLKLRNIAAFAWLQPRSVYLKIGDLDERFGRGLFEDDDYCVRVGNAGLAILCAEDSFVHHYGGASTGWGSPEYHKLFNENKIKFERKWGVKWIPHRNRKNL